MLQKIKRNRFSINTEFKLTKVEPLSLGQLELTQIN